MSIMHGSHNHKAIELYTVECSTIMYMYARTSTAVPAKNMMTATMATAFAKAATVDSRQWQLLAVQPDAPLWQARSFLVGCNYVRQG